VRFGPSFTTEKPRTGVFVPRWVEVEKSRLTPDLDPPVVLVICAENSASASALWFRD